MLITNHVLGGALVGLACPGPVSAFVVGVASHVAMDVTPHWGEADKSLFLRVAVVDGLVGLATMAYVARATPSSLRLRVVAGMLGACLPDADKPCDLFFGRSPFPPAIDRFHNAIQHESKHRMPQEFAVAASQLVTWRALVSRARLTAPRSR